MTAKPSSYWNGVNKNVLPGTLDARTMACTNWNVPKTGRPKTPSKEVIERGARIKALRDRIGISQDVLAVRCGLPNRTYVSKFENGENQASTLRAISQLAVGFRMSVDEMTRYLAGTYDPQVLPEVQLPAAVVAATPEIQSARNRKETPAAHMQVALSPSVEEGPDDHKVVPRPKVGVRKSRDRRSAAR